MKKIFFAIAGVVGIAGVLGYFVFESAYNESRSVKSTSGLQGVSSHAASGEYNASPMMECVRCVGGETWDNKPCCTDTFEQSCYAKGGVVRTEDLHPEFTVLMSCFRKASDVGKACGSSGDCLSGVCDLRSAIQAERCVLAKKDFINETQGENASGPENYFFTATYDCSSDVPGVCAEARENKENPGGETHTFVMQGKTLTETLKPGPIR